MDKFAVLQLEKKRKKEAEARARGERVGDVLHAKKQEMTEAQLDAMNEAFGYLKPPTALYTCGRQGGAACWWTWENPHPS